MIRIDPEWPMWPHRPFSTTDLIERLIVQSYLITGEQPAISAEPVPPPHTPLALLTDTAPVAAKPSRTERPRHKRPRAKSGARRGSR
jgi:hypothetical protein